MDRLFLIVAIIAAALGCVADVYLLYSPNGDYHLGDFAFFQDVSISGIVWGYFMGLLLIPLEMLGFHVFLKRLFPNKTQMQQHVFICIAYLFVLGVSYHAMAAFMGLLQKSGQHGEEIMNAATLMHDGLVAILVVSFLSIALLIFYLGKQSKNDLKRWLSIFNPIFIYAFIIGIYFFIPSVGNYLMVAGLNASILVFFLAFLLHDSLTINKSAL